MNAMYMTSFLNATSLVIEQIVGVTPIPLEDQQDIQQMIQLEKHVWIHIGLTGDFEGKIVFGIPEPVALKVVSLMMGGFEITEMNEMSQSAISELGNMISGNFSRLLSEKAIHIDITPPSYVEPTELSDIVPRQLLLVPLLLDGIGTINVQVVVSAE